MRGWQGSIYWVGSGGSGSGGSGGELLPQTTTTLPPNFLLVYIVHVIHRFKSIVQEMFNFRPAVEVHVQGLRYNPSSPKRKVLDKP